MAIKTSEGRWYGVGHLTDPNNDNDDGEYVVVEIYDSDDMFMIGINDEQCIWLSKKEFREAFAEIFNFKKP